MITLKDKLGLAAATALAHATLGSVTFEEFEEHVAGQKHRHNGTFYVGKKASRNAACPCGSGTKYKRCCMRNPEAP
jgi:uncharacterized protein YecA (UPF0149 family)